jgi:hypothetical protein
VYDIVIPYGAENKLFYFIFLFTYVQGPSPNTVVENLTDFFALELDEGKLKYYLNFGDQTQIGSILEVSSSLAHISL